MKARQPLGRLDRAGFVLQPLFLGSLVGLVINDHILKQRWPGFLTGKLSDICGLCVLTMLTWAMLLVLRPSWPSSNRKLIQSLIIVCGAIAIFFAAMKIWGPAADLYRTLNSLLSDPFVNIHGWLSGDFSLRRARTNIVQDPSDLLAIPVLIPVGLYLSRKTVLAEPIT